MQKGVNFVWWKNAFAGKLWKIYEFSFNPVHILFWNMGLTFVSAVYFFHSTILFVVTKSCIIYVIRSKVMISKWRTPSIKNNLCCNSPMYTVVLFYTLSVCSGAISHYQNRLYKINLCVSLRNNVRWYIYC